MARCARSIGAHIAAGGRHFGGLLDLGWVGVVMTEVHALFGTQHMSIYRRPAAINCNDLMVAHNYPSFAEFHRFFAIINDRPRFMPMVAMYGRQHLPNAHPFCKNNNIIISFAWILTGDERPLGTIQWSIL